MALFLITTNFQESRYKMLGCKILGVGFLKLINSVILPNCVLLNTEFFLPFQNMNTYLWRKFFFCPLMSRQVISCFHLKQLCSIPTKHLAEEPCWFVPFGGAAFLLKVSGFGGGRRDCSASCRLQGRRGPREEIRNLMERQSPGGWLRLTAPKEVEL